LIGSKAANSLKGGAGSDTLTGGLGRDALQGGKDADRFDFNSAKDTAAGKSRDVILDFSHKEGDRIDLRGLDANADKKGDQDFDLIGTKKFTGDAGDLRYEKAGKGLIVYGDMDGDKDADFSIRIDDIGSIVKGDFLL
jgi:serralysin